MSETNPTLHVFRPVQNIEIADFEEIELMARQAGIPSGSLNFYDRTPRSVLINPSDINDLFDVLDIDRTEDNICKLADYLADHLPDAFDEAIADIPTYPVVVTKTNLEYPAHCKWQFSLGGENPRVKQEREVAKGLICAFFKIEEYTTIKAEDLMPTEEHYGNIRVVQTRGTTHTEAFRNLMHDEVDFLPETFDLDPVIVEDI